MRDVPCYIYITWNVAFSISRALKRSRQATGRIHVMRANGRIKTLNKIFLGRVNTFVTDLLIEYLSATVFEYFV